jgi:hypothetical protein
MRPIGFSTGALAKADFRRALDTIREHRIDVVEFSALRLEELAPLLDFLCNLPAATFSFASVHAPSRFPPDAERSVVTQVTKAVELDTRSSYILTSFTRRLSGVPQAANWWSKTWTKGSQSVGLYQR